MASGKTTFIHTYKERINMLLEVAQTMNENHSVAELMDMFKVLMIEELDMGKLLLYTLSNGVWTVQISVGVDDYVLDSIDPMRDLTQYQMVEQFGFHEGVLAPFDAVIPLSSNHQIIGYLLIADADKEEGISPSVRNLKFVQVLANLIIVYIVNKKMEQRLLEESKTKHELSIAASIQKSLIPQGGELINNKFIECHAFYHPHYDVGGDYYDVFKFSRYQYGFIMADVSGKGMAAALLMSNFQAIVRSVFTSSISLRRMVTLINSRLNDNSKNDKYITAFIGRYNAITGRLTYVNAGHLPPMLGLPNSREVKELEEGCIAIGMLDEIPIIEQGSEHIKKGSRLVAFTDGLTELDEGGSVRNNYSKLKDILRKGNNIQSVMNSIKAMIEDDQENGYTFDDTSVLGIEFPHGSWF